MTPVDMTPIVGKVVVVVGGIAVAATLTFIAFSWWQKQKTVRVEENKVLSSSKDADVSDADVSSDSSPPVKIVQKTQPFVLGLVLKGKRLGRINSQTTLSLKEVKEALAESDYFFCTSQQKMSDIQQGMSLNKEVDRDAEQQVLVIIHFESEPEEGKIFANKLELNQFLQKGSPLFTVNSIDTLVKVSGLTKSGFVRS